MEETKTTIPNLTVMDTVTCRLCGADEHRTVDEQRGFRMVECRRCRLVYLNPRPTAQSLKQLYQDYLPNDPDAISRWNRMMAGLYRTARQRLIAHSPAGGRLADIGCAHGQFLDTMRAVGWQVEGLEICDAAAVACRRKGFDIQTTTLSGAELRPLHYDAVTLFYVLEHLREPLDGLRKIRSALKPGGLCLVRVPHTTPLVKWQRRLGRRTELYDLPFHLFDFAPSVLTRMLREAGFARVQIDIDAATRPAGRGACAVSVAASFVGRLIQRLSGGHWLLPGVSKTAIAWKEP
jgi:2-polyprenyl-3-methyl-5-hydroxy-6-metoxy-1,4-benzoquinol methylase